jgi:hypothetical protein
MKTCSKCNIEQDDNQYVCGKRNCAQCKTCRNKARKDIHKRNKEAANAITKVCDECKEEKKGSFFNEYKKICKVCESEKCKESNNRPASDAPPKTCNKCNKEQVAAQFRFQSRVCLTCEKERLYQWREENKERFLSLCKKYRDKDESKEKRNATSRERYNKEIKVKLERLYRNRIKACIKKKHCPPKTAFDYDGLLGCKIDTLIKWLEFNMTKEMTWENYGTYWHVDHIYPCSIFDFSIDENRKRCFNWTNLSPMIGIENLKKGNKLRMDLVEYYKNKVKEFLTHNTSIDILTDALPEDIKLMVTSGALDTKGTVKAVPGSGEKSEVR